MLCCLNINNQRNKFLILRLALSTTVESQKVAGGTTVEGVLFSPTLKFDGDEKDGDTPREIIHEDHTEQDAVDDDDGADEEVFNPYLFIAGLPPHSNVVIKGKICLPPSPSVGGRQTRPTLALDLDETLVHCTVEPIEKPDLTFPVTFNGTFYQVYVRKRPYLDYFLETVAKSFEVS